MVQKRSNKWETVTKSVRAWVRKHQGSERREGTTHAWTFKWGSYIANIHRDLGDDCTIITCATGLIRDDLAYYQKLGGHDWRVMMRTVNAQLGRTEVGFVTGSAPGYVVLDVLYDDAFTRDELFRRVRGVVLTGLYMLASTKLGKNLAGMRGAEPVEPSDTDVSFDTDDDLKADRMRLELAGGRIGVQEFKTTESMVGSIVLSEMAVLEKDYGPVLDTRFVVDRVVERHELPVTLIREAIDFLKKIGMIFEVEEGRIRRVD